MSVVTGSYIRSSLYWQSYRLGKSGYTTCTTVRIGMNESQSIMGKYLFSILNLINALSDFHRFISMHRVIYVFIMFEHEAG